MRCAIGSDSPMPPRQRSNGALILQHVAGARDDAGLAKRDERRSAVLRSATRTRAPRRATLPRSRSEAIKRRDDLLQPRLMAVHHRVAIRVVDDKRHVGAFVRGVCTTSSHSEKIGTGARFNSPVLGSSPKSLSSWTMCISRAQERLASSIIFCSRAGMFGGRRPFEHAQIAGDDRAGRSHFVRQQRHHPTAVFIEVHHNQSYSHQ